MKNLIQYLSTKTKFVRLGNQIVRFLKSKGSLYLLVISALLIYAPFAHVSYLNDETKGIFGFRLMVSFLFALAPPLVLISSGLIIRFIGSYTPNHIKNFSNVLSFLVTASGMFFLVWTFSEIKDYTPFTYYSVILIVSIAFTAVISKIQVYVQKQDKILLNAVKLIEGFIRIYFKYEFRTDNNKEFREDNYDNFKDLIK